MAVEWLAILNPAAGRGRGARDWAVLAAALRQRGVACRCILTAAAGEASALAAAAMQAGQRHFIAAGGDGTVHEIVNGLMQHPATATLAVAPFGTGNDWARGLGVPRAPGPLAAMVANGRTIAHDVGELSYVEGGQPRQRCFVNVAGVGYDAWVLEHLPRHGPRRLAYLAGLARGLWSYRAPRFSVRTATGGVDAPLFVAFAAIGPYCGGGMLFAPGAEPGDGLLDVVTVRHLGALAALSRLPRIYSGRVLEDPAVARLRAAAVRIETDVPARLEADGQLLGATPVSVQLRPAALHAVVP